MRRGRTGVTGTGVVRGAVPVGLLHGMRVSSLMWGPLAAALRTDRLGRDRPLALTDLPGHGPRADARFTMAAAAQTVADDLRCLPEPALLVGHSLGGFVALAVAAAHPELVAGVVAIGASSAPNGVGLAGYRWYARQLERHPVFAARVLTASARRFLPPDVFLAWTGAGYHDHVAPQAVEAVAACDPLADLAAYPGPSWLLNGSLDQFRLGERRFLAAARDGRLTVWPGHNHLSVTGDTARLAQFIEDACAVVEQGGRPGRSSPCCRRFERSDLGSYAGRVQILSIQSSVAYGHAGNSSATFCLQRLGHEAWSVHTVHFSNHTGYGDWRGPVLAATDVAEVIAGIEDRGVFAECDAVLSGYQGAEEVGAVILDAAARVKAANPAAVYCCDPVMGDVGRGFFVRPGIPEFIRDTVIPQADIVTPNQFELEFLVGARPGGLRTDADVLAAARALRERGPGTVLVTSMLTGDTPAGTISMLAVDADSAWRVQTPLLPLAVNGAGDATSALFCAQLLTDGLPVALERTAASIYGVLKVTHETGRHEIALIAAQDELVAPTLATPTVRVY